MGLEVMGEAAQPCPPSPEKLAGGERGWLWGRCQLQSVKTPSADGPGARWGSACKVSTQIWQGRCRGGLHWVARQRTTTLANPGSLSWSSSSLGYSDPTPLTFPGAMPVKSGLIFALRWQSCGRIRPLWTRRRGLLLCIPDSPCCGGLAAGSVLARGPDPTSVVTAVWHRVFSAVGALAASLPT